MLSFWNTIAEHMNINYVKRSYNIDVSSKEKNAVVYLLITVFKLRSNVRVFVCFFSLLADSQVFSSDSGCRLRQDEIQWVLVNILVNIL